MKFSNRDIYFQEDEVNSLDKKVIILYNYSDERCKSFIEVKNLMILGKKEVYTNCLSFFDTNLFKKGYDVIVLKDDGSRIILSEMALNKRNYGGRMSRYTNAYKWLVSESLSFRKNKK